MKIFWKIHFLELHCIQFNIEILRSSLKRQRTEFFRSFLSEKYLRGFIFVSLFILPIQNYVVKSHILKQTDWKLNNIDYCLYCLLTKGGIFARSLREIINSLS